MANNNATIVFGIPTGLNVPTVGSERSSSISDFAPVRPIVITDATHETDPAATISYDFGIKRGENINIIASTVDMLRATKPSVGPRPNMPSKPIGLGQFQFIVLQRAGALTATNIRLITNVPIV